MLHIKQSNNIEIFTLFLLQSIRKYWAEIIFSDTSFAPCKSENGYVVLSTKPKILFCDLSLAKGESKSCKKCFNYFIHFLEFVT